jgi:hypothetical protein
MSMQTGSVDADGLARTTDGKLYVKAAGDVSITGGSISGVTGAPTILGQSGTDVSGAADTNENTLATIAVPAAIGIHAGVRITCAFTFTSSANNKTVRVRWGGTQISGAVYTTTTGAHGIAIVTNKGVANSQTSTGILFSDSNAVAVNRATPAIDTASAVNITITGQKASAGETLTLNSYTVELLKP